MLSEKPWKPLAILFFLGGIFICLSAASSVLAIIQFFHGKEKLDENSVLYLLLATLGLHGSILLSAAVFLRWQRMSWADAFGLKHGPIRAILFGVLVAIVFLPIGMLTQMISVKLLSLLHLNAPDQQAIVTFQKAKSLGSRIYLTIFAIVIAPVAEETLFRGILYPTIKQYGYPQLALWASSLAFAAIHLSFPVFLPLTILALSLALLYEKTDNLLACITAHGVFNGINVVLLYYINAPLTGS